jgi:glycosyltransferase involved in cell wall biosynthesis
MEKLIVVDKIKLFDSKNNVAFKKKKYPLKIKHFIKINVSIKFTIFIFIINFLLFLKPLTKNKPIDNNKILRKREIKKTLLEETYLINSINKSTLNNNITINDKLIISENELKYDSLFTALERSINFVNETLQGIVLSNTAFKSSDNPLITVVIPVYNGEKTITRAIRSIQNQNITDVEIILVNDLSMDNSSYIIEQLIKEDPRIKLINNQKNMGTLYSRCIGSLSAKGKYIFPLDNDDLFLDKDVFHKIAIETAEKYDFDIVEFRAIEAYGINHFFKRNVYFPWINKHIKGQIVFQPELAGFSLKTNKDINKYDINDSYIWAKCIKTEIYKKAITSYGEERYSNFVTVFEDIIVNFLIFQFAKSFIFIPKYGILRIFSNSSAYSHTSPYALNKFEMRLLDAVIDFSKNTLENKKIVVNISLKLFSNFGLKETLQKEKYKNLLKSILERIIKCEYISKEDKQMIREKSSNFSIY